MTRKCEKSILTHIYVYVGVHTSVQLTVTHLPACVVFWLNRPTHIWVERVYTRLDCIESRNDLRICERNDTQQFEGVLWRSNLLYNRINDLPPCFTFRYWSHRRIDRWSEPGYAWIGIKRGTCWKYVKETTFNNLKAYFGEQIYYTFKSMTFHFVLHSDIDPIDVYIDEASEDMLGSDWK